MKKLPLILSMDPSAEAWMKLCLLPWELSGPTNLGVFVENVRR